MGALVSVAVSPANSGLILPDFREKAGFGVAAPTPAPPESLRYPSHTPPDTHRRFKFEPTVCVGRDNGEATERLRRDDFEITVMRHSSGLAGS